MSRIHAVIVGIDTYKYGNIWDLESCGDDAKAIKRWLTHNLDVPRNQIHILTNSDATQAAIEASLTQNLLHNPAIIPGDAVFIYFAGYGSTLHAPRAWGGGRTQVLCAYDHDTKGLNGKRIAGITDRAFTSFLHTLSRVKGDNITVMIDAAFAPEKQTRENIRERRFIRWTATTKAGPRDLSPSFLPTSDEPQGTTTPSGGFHTSTSAYTLILSASPGEPATENKEGGKFTRAFLEARRILPIYNTTVSEIIEHITEALESAQTPLVVGNHAHSVLFLGLPFTTDVRFVHASQLDRKRFRVDMGSTEGVEKGTEFSLHSHNHRGSKNPSIGCVRVTEVHSTWVVASLRSTPVSGAEADAKWATVSKQNRNSLPHFLRGVVQKLSGGKGAGVTSSASAGDVVSLAVRRVGTETSESQYESDASDLRKKRRASSFIPRRDKVHV